MFLVVWTTDISGYVFGRIFKGPKFLPSISPNKTWSGFLSGVVLSEYLVLFFFYFTWKLSIYKFFSYLVLGAIVSSLGDLLKVN